MDSVVATVSGYHGSERFNLIKLISQSGASYVGAMNPSTTHLVCRKFEGKKYELARKFKIIVVNHRWIEDCIKQGRRVSERSYTKHCGLEVGPLLLEVPVVADEARNLSDERRTTSNFSKKPVIDIEDDESGDDDWKDSWLLKENLLPDATQNKNHSTKLKRKGTKRRLRQDGLLTDRYSLDESTSFDLRTTESDNLSCPSPSHQVNQRRKNITISESSKGTRRLIHKNISNELKSSSDSEETIHHHRNRSHNRQKRNIILEDLEEIEDLGTFSSLQDPVFNHSNRMDSLNNSPEVNDESNKSKCSPRLFTQQQPLSCVICWTDFSSTRGVLPCGHRFCFSCIQNWADHMASMKKVSTCPLCKASFYSIQKMEDALSCDQKIYSQTVPNNHTSMDVYILQPHNEAFVSDALAPSRPVCYQCGCLEPEELLVRCDRCQIHSVHSYCLDPPIFPWVCFQCKDLRMRYLNFR